MYCSDYQEYRRPIHFRCKFDSIQRSSTHSTPTDPHRIHIFMRCAGYYCTLCDCENLPVKSVFLSDGESHSLKDDDFGSSLCISVSLPYPVMR